MKWYVPYEHGDEDLGGGRGSSGIMYYLLRVPEITNDPTYRDHLEKTVTFFIGRQDDDG